MINEDVHRKVVKQKQYIVLQKYIMLSTCYVTQFIVQRCLLILLFTGNANRDVKKYSAIQNMHKEKKEKSHKPI